jgi:hypothetical protein
MKKLFLSIAFILPFSIYAQSAITIEPNPTSTGILTDLKLNDQGKVVAVNDAIKTYYYNASNLDFMPNTTNSVEMNKFTRDDITYGTAYFGTTAPEEDFMLAPIDLPHGATIIRLRSYYIDESTGANGKNLTIKLIRRAKGTNGNPLVEELIASNVSTTPTLHHNFMDIETSTATLTTNNVVDNITYHYFIKIIVAEIDFDVNFNWVGNILAIRDVELQYTF